VDCDIFRLDVVLLHAGDKDQSPPCLPSLPFPSAARVGRTRMTYSQAGKIFGKGKGREENDNNGNNGREGKRLFLLLLDLFLSLLSLSLS